MTHLTLFEREVIESGVRAKKGIREIAGSLGRNHGVIAREIKRNTFSAGRYYATTAHRAAIQREARRHKPKLEQAAHQDARRYIVNKLTDYWSPEQIAGTLNAQSPPEAHGTTVATETIYRYIYEGEGRFENLHAHLRRARRHRVHQRARKPRKIHIPKRVSVHARPPDDGRPGTWESDTVEGRRTTKGNLSVQYERSLMLARLHQVKNKSAHATEEALRASIDSLPGYLWRSITFDNGGESATHATLRSDFGIATYHCDAYASWQKGGVENLNGLIRQYIPKGTDISKLSSDYIQIIEDRLNTRPRKKLNYLTPNQVLEQALVH